MLNKSLKQLRHMIKHGDQKIIAAKTGICRNTISEFLNGKKTVSAIMAANIIHAAVEIITSRKNVLLSIEKSIQNVTK